MHGKQTAPHSPTQAEGITACVGEVTRVWDLQGGPRLASWQMHNFSPGQSYSQLPRAASWLQKKSLFPSHGLTHLEASIWVWAGLVLGGHMTLRFSTPPPCDATQKTC